MIILQQSTSWESSASLLSMVPVGPLKHGGMYKPLKCNRELSSTNSKQRIVCCSPWLISRGLTD